MKEGPNISKIASLIGDPARAHILTALMSGKALTASELSNEAGITIQTCSYHLAQLYEYRLIEKQKQGRHKYFRLNGQDVACLLESLMNLTVKSGHSRTRTGPKDQAIRKARVCYNHLAGEVAVIFYEKLLKHNFISSNHGDICLNPIGEEFFTYLGMDMKELSKTKSPLCKECLDWSERRSHLAGKVGRKLLEKIEENKWAKRNPKSREVSFTTIGEKLFINAIDEFLLINS